MDEGKQHTQAKEREEGGRDHAVGKEEKKRTRRNSALFLLF